MGRMTAEREGRGTSSSNFVMISYDPAFLTHLLKTDIPALVLSSLGSMAERCGTRTTPKKEEGSRGLRSKLTSSRGVPFTSNSSSTSSVSKSLKAKGLGYT